jgi:hypothetical protein
MLIVVGCSPSPVPSPLVLGTATRATPTPSAATPTSAQIPVATPTPSPSQSPAGLAWQRTKGSYCAGGTNSRTCVPFGNRVDGGLGSFVAVDSDGKIWRSDDGVTWRSIAGVPGMSLVRSDGTPQGLIGAGCAREAVGEEGYGCAVHAIWRSVDGTHWRRANRIVGLAYPKVGAEVQDITANAGRFVAVGSAVFGRSARPVMLTSTDGVTWRIVPGVPDRRVAFWDEIRPAGGGFIATGWTENGRVFAWTSSDGQAWSHSVELPDIVGNIAGSVSPVVETAGGPGYVIAGRSPHGGSEILTSADGVHWAKAPDQAALAGATIDWIVSTASGLVAAGSKRSAEEGVGPGLTIWRSTDGMSWATAPDQPPPAMTGQGLGTDGQRVVLLMCNLDTEECESWTSPIAP